MQTLQYWQEKIQEKRKQTPFREFVREICSWSSVNLYRTGGLISRYPNTGRVTMCSTKDFIENQGEYVDTYGVGVSSDESFFSQLVQLHTSVPLPNLLGEGGMENCDFADGGGHSKNIYLSFIVSTESENVAYCRNGKSVTNGYNSCAIWSRCENIYQCEGVTESFNIFYSRGVHASSNLRFCSNCIGCVECLLCDDLVNQSYCFRNVQYTQEEYFVIKKEFLEDKSAFDMTYHGVSMSPNFNVLCENVSNIAVSSSIKNGRNILFSGGSAPREEFYDVLAGGITAHFYGVYQGIYFSEHIYCSAHITKGLNIFYSYKLTGCSFCLGCIGLKNKSYCILNKQYTKEERYEKVDAIFSQMEADGTLGQFFPASMCPFYFNDTAAYLIDPTFTKDEVTKLGYLRRDEPIRVDIPERMETVKTTELDQYESTQDGQRTINPDILKKVIIDEQGNSYRVIKMEYEFLVKHGLPLPRKHWLERMKENFRIS